MEGDLETLAKLGSPLSGDLDSLPTSSREKLMLPVLLLIPLLLVLPLSLQAAIHHVPDDFQTIQAAIDDTSTVDGDIILLEPGEYTENINYFGKLITIASRYYDTGDESYITQTILNGNEAGRVVIFRNGETNEAQLIGLTITNGRYTYGGGVYISGCSPSLKRLIITGNTATNNGGGIYCTSEGAAPIMDHITLVGNTGGAYGGFNAFNPATATFTNSIIWANNPPDLPARRVISYSNVEGGDDQNGNIERDPGFVDIDAGDFNLLENSGCVDAGDPDATPDPDGTRTDMGALSYSHFPIIAVEPEAINFGERHYGNTFQNTVLILNAGRILLQVEALTIQRQDSPFSIVSGGDPVELAPGDTSVVTIQFSPVAAGEFSDSLVIPSNDPEQNPLYVSLSGLATPPEPILGITPLRINFGDVALLTQSEASFTIRNTGDADLAINDVRFEENALGLFTLDFNGAFSIVPGAEHVVTLLFRPDRLGAQSENVSVESNDPQIPHIVLTTTATGVRPEPHWQYNDNTGVNHSILVLSAVIDGDPLPLGSEIAVLTPDGLCVGEEFWLGERIGFAVWGDNEMTEEIDGYTEGDPISYRLWDIVAQTEYVAQAELVEGDLNFALNGLSVVNLTVRTEPLGFQIYTSDSWSIVSAPVIPEVVHIPTLWRPVVQRGHLVIMKDASGRFYVASIGFSNMANWDYRQGYLVKGSAVDSLEVVGEEVAEDAEIPLRQGWNLAAYFPVARLTAPVAFRNIRDNLLLAKDASGRFYVPSIGFSNMAPLQRGQGYYVRLSQETTLVYNLGQAAAVYRPELPPVHFVAPAPTGNSMSLLLDGGADFEGCEVAAITPSGEIVGAVLLSGHSPWGMAVWGDDPTTIERDGAIDGEALKIVGFGNEKTLEIQSSWQGNSTFESDGFDQARLEIAEPLPKVVTLDPPSPNPFNSFTTLTFALPANAKVRLTVFDLAGKEVAHLADGQFSAGTHKISWNADRSPTGVYLAKLETESTVRTTKMMLIR